MYTQLTMSDGNDEEKTNCKEIIEGTKISYT